jgi:hypothetical protein
MKHLSRLVWIVALMLWPLGFVLPSDAASLPKDENRVQQEIVARLLKVLVSETDSSVTNEKKSSAALLASRGPAEHLLEAAALAMLPLQNANENPRKAIESRLRHAANSGTPLTTHNITETSARVDSLRRGCLQISPQVATLLLLRALQRSQHVDLAKELAPAATNAIRKAEDRLAASDFILSESASNQAEFVENAVWYTALFESVGPLRQLGQIEEARRALKLAERLHAAIERNFWVSEGRYYTSAVVTTPSLHMRGRSPELRPQLVAIALLPSNSSLRELFSEIWEAHGDLPSSATTPRQLELLAWLALAAHAAGESVAWAEILARIAGSSIEEAVSQCPALAWLIARACFPT